MPVFVASSLLDHPMLSSRFPAVYVSLLLVFLPTRFSLKYLPSSGSFRLLTDNQTLSRHSTSWDNQHRDLHLCPDILQHMSCKCLAHSVAHCHPQLTSYHTIFTQNAQHGWSEVLLQYYRHPHFVDTYVRLVSRDS